VRINDCGPESLHYCEPDALPLQAATIMSLALDSRYAISEKPREKGRTWLAHEITRARAKLNGHQPTATRTPKPDAELTDQAYHTLEHGSVPDATYKNDPVSPQALLSDAEPPEGWLQKGEHHGCQPLLP
jgi:hypothetical protein